MEGGREGGRERDLFFFFCVVKFLFFFWTLLTDTHFFLIFLIIFIFCVLLFFNFSDRYGAPVKIETLKTILLLLNKGGARLRPFIPQLQTTFVKNLSDGKKF